MELNGYLVPISKDRKRGADTLASRLQRAAADASKTIDEVAREAGVKKPHLQPTGAVHPNTRPPLALPGSGYKKYAIGAGLAGAGGAAIYVGRRSRKQSSVLDAKRTSHD